MGEVEHLVSPATIPAPPFPPFVNMYAASSSNISMHATNTSVPAPTTPMSAPDAPAPTRRTHAPTSAPAPTATVVNVPVTAPSAPMHIPVFAPVAGSTTSAQDEEMVYHEIRPTDESDADSNRSGYHSEDELPLYLTYRTPSSIQLSPLPVGQTHVFPDGITTRRLLANVDKASQEAWSSYKGNAIFVLVPHSKAGADIVPKANKVKAALRTLFDCPKVIVGVPGYVNNGWTDARPLYPLFVAGISKKQKQILIGRICWNTPGITFFAVPTEPFVTAFVMTLGGLTLEADPEDEIVVAHIVKHHLKTSGKVRGFIAKHNDLFDGDYSVADILNEILHSVEARALEITVDDAQATVFNIYMCSPTSDPTNHEAWIRLLKNISYVSHHGSLTPRKPEFNCASCYALDHPTGLCPYPELPGWFDAKPPAPAPAQPKFKPNKNNTNGDDNSRNSRREQGGRKGKGRA